MKIPRIYVHILVSKILHCLLLLCQIFFQQSQVKDHIFYIHLDIFPHKVLNIYVNKATATIYMVHYKDLNYIIHSKVYYISYVHIHYYIFLNKVYIKTFFCTMAVTTNICTFFITNAGLWTFLLAYMRAY